MREYQVGELFTVGKDTYKCVVSGAELRCVSCDYGEVNNCNYVCCYSDDRNDGESVIFTLYDSEE